MSANPFLSLDRQNFPAFSPMFKKKTPSSTEKSSSFRWSIDQIARLKPADIDIDPATLVKTNGHSPAVDSDAENASENFFSQKTILPSPWTAAPVPSGKLGPPGSLPTKRVTFSPLPPATAFIREESLVESEIRDNRTTDAGTQTLLTFPVNFDLYQLLGPGFNYPEEKSAAAAACDLGNSSLRRKLFGQPDRQGSISLSSSLSSEGGDDAQPAVENSPPQAIPFTPLQDQLKTPVSQKPLHHPSSSSTPSNHLFSSAIVFDADIDGDPAHSSMILGVHGNGPPDISPIGCSGSEMQSVSASGEEGGSSEETKEKEGSGIQYRKERLAEKVSCQQKYPSTPSKDVHMQSLPCLSPICGMGISPMPVNMLHQQSPFHHCHGNASTPAHPTVASRIKVPHTTSSGKATCTSTPNTAALKRQLVASPFASPVLKQPCTKRLDILEEDSTHSPPPNRHLHHPHPPNHRDIPGDESDSESSIPQPLSLADLRTETYELTSITPTTCTSDFAQFGLDDPTENAGPHPLHSLTAGHMTMMSSIPAHWNPPIHSTMVDSHYKIQGSDHLTTKPIPQVSLPLVGGLSRIQSHSHSTANGTSENRSQSGVIADSGVAASGEFNFNNTTAAMIALHSNMKAEESGIAISGGDPVLKVVEAEERVHVGQDIVGGGAKIGGILLGNAPLASKLHSRPDCKTGRELMANREANFERKYGIRLTSEKIGGGSEDKLRRAVTHCHSEVDSGLVFSPEHNFLEHIPEGQPAAHQHTSERMKFHPLSPSPRVGSGYLSEQQHKFHQETPSRHSNLQPSVGFLVPMSPAAHHHHHNIGGGGAPGLINNGLGGHYPAFSSRLTSKCAGISSGAVLPSRLKLSSTNAMTAGLKSPSYMYSSFVPHHNNCRGKENGAPLSSINSQDVFGVGGASKTTPTSRYSGKGTLKSLSDKSNLSSQMDEVIRKKEAVKARLQFTSPVDSQSMIPSGGSSSRLLRSPVSTKTMTAPAAAYVGRPRCRIPLCETSLNRPRSPLTRWNSEGFTPFSPSPLPSQLSPVPHHAHPFVVKSPWQPPISLSPVDTYHSRRARLKLSST